MDTPIGTNSEQRERRRARITRRAQGFWSSDQSLTVLLVLLVANIFIVPVAQFATWGRLSGRAILSLIIISDRKSTRLNSSHANISYAVFCLKKKHPSGSPAALYSSDSSCAIALAQLAPPP